MEKITALLLALALILTLSACGAGDPGEKDPVPGCYRAISCKTGEATPADLSVGGFVLYMVLEEDGTGYLDMSGDRYQLIWDDKAITGGAEIPYTYKKGVLIIENGGVRMTFQKLSGEELERYLANAGGAEG